MMVRHLPSLVRCLVAALFVATVPVKAGGKAPDFSAVTSKEAVEQLVRKHKLVPVHLFPVNLGGQDVPENISYVPPEAAEAIGLLHGTLERFTREGLINRLTIDPEYRGDSFVPVRIRMRASHTRKKGGFNPNVDIW